MYLIKCAQMHLDRISYPPHQTVSDFTLETDYGLSEFSGNYRRYNAIVEIGYDKMGRVMNIEVTILSQEKEPPQQQEELEYVSGDPLLEHLHKLHKEGKLTPNVASSFGLR